jgi:hypothetical protein
VATSPAIAEAIRRKSEHIGNEVAGLTTVLTTERQAAPLS